MSLPSPNSEFLGDVVDCVRRRTKALRHKWSDHSIDRVIVREAETEIEKLEFRARLATRAGTLTYWVHVFEDRWINLFARKMVGRTVIWFWGTEGRLLNPAFSQSLVSAIEETGDNIAIFDECGALSPEQEPALTKRYRELLSQSPEEVGRAHRIEVDQ